MKTFKKEKLLKSKTKSQDTVKAEASNDPIVPDQESLDKKPATNDNQN